VGRRLCPVSNSVDAERDGPGGTSSGAGFTTRRFTVFVLVKSAAGIATRSCPELINTVVRAESFHVTVDPVTNCDPVMVTQVFRRAQLRRWEMLSKLTELDSDSRNGAARMVRATEPLVPCRFSHSRARRRYGSDSEGWIVLRSSQRRGASAPASGEHQE